MTDHPTSALLQAIAELRGDVKALRETVESRLADFGRRIANLEDRDITALQERVRGLEQSEAKTRGYTLGISAAIGFVVTALNIAITMWR